MRKKVILISGAAGEIGLALIEALAGSSASEIVTLDLKPLPAHLNGDVTHLRGDILDDALLARIVSEYEIDEIFHLAALLSTRCEFSPMMAHKVNVEGTLRLLQLAADQSERRAQPVRFMFPSSIAVYGLPNLEAKEGNPCLREEQFNQPASIYGCNKLYCELLGLYFGQHFQRLAARRPELLDFRCLRFPGLISAQTLPSGGTSDYGPEMLHAAAQGEAYDCFVRADTTIPFMAMPDAVEAMLLFAASRPESLSRRVYNVTSFSLSAAEIRALALQAFPQAEIRFKPDLQRQDIVDSWPAGLDDGAARHDWGWRPAYDARRAFDAYLIPEIVRRYA
ncbi:MAG: NAD-dependent epimerase/dehydratase family protein [Candidatus Promineifilaceae bacterium]